MRKPRVKSHVKQAYIKANMFSRSLIRKNLKTIKRVKYEMD